MSATTITLPSSVDDIDDTIDALWEPLRGQPLLDRVFYTASTVGDFSVIWHGYNIGRLVTGKATKQQFARLAIGLAVESLIVNQGIKRVFGRSRPSTAEDRPRHLRQPSTSSFPSGHASAATVAALLLSENTRARPLIIAMAATVALSRVHVRIHHASDVVAGAAVGAALGATWKRVWPLEAGSSRA